MDRFRFSLTDQEKAYLKNLALGTVARDLQAPAPPQAPRPDSPRLDESLGAFVTLTRHGELRGCIGNLVGQGPLENTVTAMARAAAFQDPRFPPLEARELPELDVEISIMGPITPCPDPGQVEVGRHGLIMRRGARQGLLLPQVPVEWGWDRETFLAQTCRKAGLPPEAWKEPGTEIFWFEAEVF